MNSLTTDSFYAERQRNGDVWISSRKREWTRNGTLPPKENEPVIIPADKCRGLARLLWPEREIKVDYNRGRGEPE